MAGIPLNTFRTVTTNPVSLNETIAYIATTGLTSIVLMAQAATIGLDAGLITFKHYRPQSSSNPQVGGQPIFGDTSTVIINSALVPPNDALVMLGGKLVLETFDYITVKSDQDGTLQAIFSILETANQ